jgi:CRP/FNR family transcriptional regulator, cyclic AMP receptor protein
VRLEEDLAAQLSNTSEKRLARVLLQLSGYGKRPGRTPAISNLDQGTLAQVVGTTRSRVSHFMNEFRKKGYIQYNGNLQVHKGLHTFLGSTQPARERSAPAIVTRAIAAATGL